MQCMSEVIEMIVIAVGLYKFAAFLVFYLFFLWFFYAVVFKK